MELAAVRHYPYVDLDDIIEADPNYAELTPHQLRFLDRLTEESDGIVMTRHAPPLAGRSDRPLFAELRPLDAVRTGTRRHNFTDKNGKLWDHHITLRSAAWEKHVNRHEQLDDHHGVNNTEDHLHITSAKYLFPPGKPKKLPWKNHDHTAMAADKLGRHLENHEHDEGDETVHYRDGKDPKENRAKRIDVHPWALERMRDAETVYFALEGCLKADSILSHIIDHKLRASVFSVPSVTLWDAPGLHAFAQQYLRDKLVIIVPDSDWEDPDKDGAVIAQSLYCRDQLAEWLGRDTVHIAAPSPEPGPCENHPVKSTCYPECDRPVRDVKRGVDDYLADGGMLRDMVIIDRQAPHALDGWGGTSAPSRPGRSRDTRLLRFLSLHADETTGEYHAPLKTMERRGGIDRKAVRLALQNLIDAGAITSDVPLRIAGYRDRDGKVVEGTWIPWPDHNPYGAEWGISGWVQNEAAWADMPTLTVATAPLDFRARTLRSFTVADIENPLRVVR